MEQAESADREIKFQRAWVEGELEQRAAVVHVRNRMGALEVGSAVQVQQAEERMGALEAGLAAQVKVLRRKVALEIHRSKIFL